MSLALTWSLQARKAHTIQVITANIISARNLVFAQVGIFYTGNEGCFRQMKSVRE